MNTYREPNMTIAPGQFNNCPDFLERYLTYLSTFVNRAASTVIECYTALSEFCQYIHYQNRIGEEPPTKDAHKDMDITCMDLDEVCVVTQDQVEEYLGFLDVVVKNSQGTLHKKLCILRSFFSYVDQNAKDLGVTLKYGNPCQHISNIQGRELPARMLSAKQIAQLANGTTGRTALRDKAIILLISSSGLTLSEVVNLDRRNVKGNTLTVGSKRNVRTVSISKPCENALRKYMQTTIGQEDTDPLFQATETGSSRRLTARSISYRIEKAANTAGLSSLNISASDLRDTATAAALLCCSSYEYEAILRYMGYTSPNSIRRFQHLLPPRSDADSKGIERAIQAAFQEFNDGYEKENEEGCK